MSNLGIRARLFLVCLGLILSAELASGLFIASELRAWHVQRIESELGRAVQVAQRTVQRTGQMGPDALADELGAALGLRVTVIAQDGRVLGDSQFSGAALESLESHEHRPEIKAALTSGRGTARRYSDSIGTDMLYVASPTLLPDRGLGVVRVAMSLADIDLMANNLRWLFAVAALVGFAMALLLSWAASHVFSRTLRQLVHNARVAASGDRRTMLPRVEDELGGLTSSVRQMAAELERVVSALASERDRVEAVLEAMDDGVLAIDADRVITLVNESARLMVGRGDSPVGKRLEEAVTMPALSELVDKARDGHSVSAEIELHGDTERILMTRATPLRMAGGAVVVLQDVTRLRHLETVRRDFVANASHELRTPVSIIQANVETLLDGAVNDPVRAKQFLEAMGRHAERLSRLMADLLDLSKLESGQYALQPHALDVQRVVAEALHAVEHSAQAKGLVVHTDVPASLFVLADAKALDQVLVNLLDNAIKYTPNGGRVDVTTRVSNRAVRLEVRDDGPGIDPAHRPRLFERFYRVDTGRSRAMGGTGLGLAIVKHLAMCMDGSVGMDPVIPHGSCFWIELPRASSGVRGGAKGQLPLYAVR